MRAGSALLTLLLSSTCSEWLFAAEADRPNILLVMTDDQGYGDLSLHGNPVLQTPQLDRFARGGIQFSQFHVSPYCAPTRASLLTGRYSLRTGVTSVTHNKEVMRTYEVTLAEALRSAGYRTACIGKWHNGEQFPHDATGQGFDEFFGFRAGNVNNYFDAELLRGTEVVPTQGFMPDVLTDEAIAFMKRNQHRPFFCYLPYNTPHTPSQVPDEYFDRYKAQGLDDELAAIYGMCANLDDNFGRLLATLDELKIRDRTIVLFLTDNGANGDRYNAGMRGWKTSVHEGGTRVPLFMQWPQQFPEPRTIRQLAAHIDLYPTLLELCGVQPPWGPAVDGISLVPWLKGETDTKDRYVFIHSAHPIPAVPFPGGIRTARYRCVCEDPHARTNQATWQLYDLQTDPGETTDLAAQHPELVAELAQVYARWWGEVQHGYDPPHRVQVGHATENPVTLHAPQSVHEGVTFHHGPGFAHLWLTGWTRTEARVQWAVDVVTPGEYLVDLICSVSRPDAGARIRVSGGGSSAEALTRPFDSATIPRPHRVAEEHELYMDRTWDRQRIGILTLPAGSTMLTVEALAIPGNAAMDLKGITLTKCSDVADDQAEMRPR